VTRLHTTSTTPVNKAEVARTVYAEYEQMAIASKNPMVRKNVVAAIAARANLSEKGAQTYYQTIRKNKAEAAAKALVTGISTSVGMVNGRATVQLAA